MSRRRLPIAPIISVVSVLVIIGAIVLYRASADHSVLPGIKGCDVMRDVTAQSHCVAKQLGSLMQGTDTEDGLRRVDALAASDPLVQAHCHLAMHIVGEAAGRADAKRHVIPTDVGGSTTCRKGFTHGSMLGYISTAKDISIATALGGMCKPEGDNNMETDCVHVLGHLIARRAGQDHAEQQLAKNCVPSAMRTDTSRTVSVSDQNECLRGGYMEMAINAHQPPLEDWRKLCDKAPERGRVQCFAWLPPIAAYRELPKGDAAKECQREASGSAIQRDCMAGIARAV